MQETIPFSQPHSTGRESEYMNSLFGTHHFASDGNFSKKCVQWFQDIYKKNVVLTQSATSALEIATLILDLKPGDEVIMPSFTFVSTANAIVLRGAIPVFMDIRPDTLNMDENLLEREINSKTKAILPVHYAGISCEMTTIKSLARKHNLHIIEDSAQGILSKYQDNYLGTMGDFGVLSFHDTKNIHCGEGGLLFVNNEKFADRAEVISQKGTDRSRFLKGEVDKYTWQDVGSSYAPSEIQAAFLLAQLEKAQDITNQRIQIWNRYHKALENLEEKELLRRPIMPADCHHNGHIYHILLPTEARRNHVLKKLKEQKIMATFHFIPLHSSPAGRKFTKTNHTLPVTDDLSRRLLRLPIWPGLNVDRVIDVLSQVILKGSP
jgi:dTDP-4-amino-4,6-dideoxygalactose transaminase